MSGIESAVVKLRLVAGLRPRQRSLCQICSAPFTRSRAVKDRRTGQALTAALCSRCGFAELLGVASEPDAETADPVSREFAMARLGVELLGRERISALVCGPSSASEAVHIARLDEVELVAVGGIGAADRDRQQIDVSRAAGERFDLVVVAELAERFRDPHADFARLFGYVAPDGLLVCSVTRYDGRRLERPSLAPGLGHGSCYSPGALRRIAEASQMQVSVRHTLPMTGPAGERRRYVVFRRPARGAQAAPVSSRRDPRHAVDPGSRTPIGRG
jgi:Methyltransferase domain